MIIYIGIVGHLVPFEHMHYSCLQKAHTLRCNPISHLPKGRSQVEHWLRRWIDSLWLSWF